MSDLKEKLQQTLSGNYTIERELGGGGMSRVFVAEETSLGRRVVVKVLPPELAAAVNLERFRREIQVAARLSHPHIVPVLAAGSSDGLPYYTMPFIEGESLRARIARHGELPNHDAARILRDVLSALAYAHDHGVIHRDIKPDNILLSGGHALVADFGVAKALSASTDPGSSLTSMGVALGTPAYMAPEQAAGDPVTDHRADLYAVAAVAYEMLTGYQLFSARSPQAMLAAHAAESPEPILKKRPSIPPLLADLIMRALEKRPADRPQTAGEMLAQLEAATTPSGATTPYSGGIPPHVRGNNRKRNLILGVSALAAVTAAIAVGLLRSEKSAQPVSEPSVTSTPSLAVLPFENLGSSDDAYFADGMTEEISSRLGRLSGLRVIGRQSVRGYADSPKPVQQIGKELGVAYILTGTVRWDKSSGSNRVRVSPALLNVTDGSQLWSESYEDVVKGVFQIQSSVAEKVAGAMQLTLKPSEAQSLSRPRTDNVEAYDNYLRGLALNRSWVTQDLIRAAGFFEKAVALDPKFVDAWAALGNAHVDALWFGDASPDRLKNSKAAVDRAILLDPNSGQARSASANYYYHGSRDYARALQELEIAERIAPNEVSTYVIKGRILRRQGKFEEAIQAYKKALSIDPKTPSGLNDLGETYKFANRYRESGESLRRLLTFDPANVQAYTLLAFLPILSKGDVLAAIAVYQEASQRIGPEVLGPNLVTLNGYIWPAYLEPRISELMHSQVPPESSGAQADFYAARGLLAFYERNPVDMRLAGEAMKKLVLANWPSAWNKPAEFMAGNDLTGMVALGHAFLGNYPKALELGKSAIDRLPYEKDVMQGQFNLDVYARIAVIANDRDQALWAIGKLIHAPGISAAMLNTDPMFESLRSDPRFIRILANK